MTTTTSITSPTPVTFDTLNLHAAVLSAVVKTGYTVPTEVQLKAIPAGLLGRDLLVSSQTGSGKTAAFLLPSLNRLTEPSKVAGKGPRILVLTPTRELAIQVEKAAEEYACHLRKFRSAVVVGGAPFGVQTAKLRASVDLVVATPGRLLDHMNRRTIDLSRVEVLILDEADRMLDMGFIDDIRSIVDSTPVERQTLLFSATLEGVVGSLARELTDNPERIEITAPALEKAQIEQRVIYADDFGHKIRLLKAILADKEVTQAVVFAATKRSADDLAQSLLDDGFMAAALHGDMKQSLRNRTLQQLRDQRTQVLVATDVAARGIDVPTLSHVINFDPPRQAEDYVHRIGRTGRAGRTGIAITLVGRNEGGLLRDIERYTGERANLVTIEGLEAVSRPDPRAKPQQGRRKPGGNGNGKVYGGYAGNAASNGANNSQGRGYSGFGAKPAFNDRFADSGAGGAGGANKPSFGGYAKREGAAFGDKPAYGGKPGGFGGKPSGFGSKPSGFGGKPSFGDRAEGFAKPSGFGAKPAGFGAKPSGFGSQPSYADRSTTDRASGAGFGKKRFDNAGAPPAERTRHSEATPHAHPAGGEARFSRQPKPFVAGPKPAGAPRTFTKRREA